MITPRIPENILVLFRRFAALPPEIVKEFAGALGRSPVCLSFVELVANLSDAVSTLDPQNVRDVLRLIAFSYSLETNLGLASGEAAMLVVQAAMSGADMESERTFTAAGERLAGVLRNAHAINLIARADDLAAELPNRCQDVRIVTDVRPIFGEGVVNTPNAGILVHTLRISYVDGDRVVQAYFSLDDKSLIKLDGQVERARSKQQSLEVTLRDSNIPIIRKGTA